jgi:outer membrane protein assembly factor BamD (BamD/ComL family)
MPFGFAENTSNQWARAQAAAPPIGRFGRVAAKSGRQVGSLTCGRAVGTVAIMRRWCVCALLTAAVAAFPTRAPAPLVYTPGEGFTYEPVGGGGAWRRAHARDQLDVAQTAFDKQDFALAMKAAKRVVANWPISDYAPNAQYLIARCYEQDKQDEKAFKAYQTLLEKYPKVANYDEVLQRQFAICNRFLAGEWFKLWGYVPFFPSMDKTVTMYEKLIKNGPYSDVAPHAQLNIGAAREKQSRFLNDQEPYIEAAKAYELAADRYHDRPQIAADATFKEGLAYQKQARTAEYDQSAAQQAIDTFVDFMTLFPDDSRVKQAEAAITALQTVRARGNFMIAKFYESGHHWEGARTFYNEVVQKDPNSPYAAPSLQRIAELNKLIQARAR